MKKLFLFAFFILLIGCSAEPLVLDRESSIPPDAVKMTPEMDNNPPILHSDEYENPVPLAVINTAGAEDSPFIPKDRDEMYFVFVKDVREEIHVQIRDPVNGIWVSKNVNGAWQKPEFVQLQNSDKLALNGCEFVEGNFMLFCTAREGYTGMHWFSAEYKDNKWTGWKNADFNSEYETGELHINGNELYYHSTKTGGKGDNDIWMITNIDGEWKNPVNVEAVNTESNEGMPYITPDGVSCGSIVGIRSKRINDEWQEPELIISPFAGEPTIGNNQCSY